ncbi:MAG: hypothetical protein IJV36_07705 [Prevotella sp.]|nr:hypothetical protein [Prevotella sp.]
MKETISFRRMWQLTRYYWRTEKKTYLRLFLGLVAVYVFKSVFFWFLGRYFSIESIRYFLMLFNDEWIFWGFILISMAHMFPWLQSKQRATTFLALPASNMEKFLSRVVYATLGIWLLAFVGRATGNGITAIPALIDTLFLNGKLTLSWILQRSILPATWTIFSADTGGLFILWALKFLLLTGLIAIWPWSLFTLFGVLFRRNGWLWAIPVLFVGVFIAYLIFDVSIGHTWLVQHNTLFFLLFSAFSLLPAAFNYWLSYRCFSRAQVVTNTSTRLH